jgi:hypothetical protein
MTLPIYVGYDRREPRTYEACLSSFRRNSSIPISFHKLDAQRLAERGLLRRAQDTRGGQRYDIPSNAYASTEFAISRFLVPILQQSGWALFVDSDTISLHDVGTLLHLADPRKALQVVQHQLESPASAVPQYKMDTQVQQAYNRKNWSSVMLFNCDHPAHKRLSLTDVQERRGLDLHHFYWLSDDEIGALPGEWNWLVGVQPKPDKPCIAHFTLGTPELGVTSDYDHLWNKYAPAPDRSTAA